MYIRALCVDLLAEDVRYIIPNDHYVVGTDLEHITNDLHLFSPSFHC
ncbi:hypothetical protein [Vibrio sp. NH-UV-68]